MYERVCVSFTHRHKRMLAYAQKYISDVTSAASDIITDEAESLTMILDVIKEDKVSVVSIIRQR